MKKQNYLFLFSGMCFIILVAINIICYLITKFLSIGFNEGVLGAYLVLPAIYAFLCAVFSIFLDKRVLWVLPFLVGIFYIISAYPSSIYGRDLVIGINIGLSGIFNLVQFIIQKEEMNNLFSFYFIHIFCMIVFLVIVMRFSYKRFPFGSLKSS